MKIVEMETAKAITNDPKNVSDGKNKITSTSNASEAPDFPYNSISDHLFSNCEQQDTSGNVLVSALVNCFHNYLKDVYGFDTTPVQDILRQQLDIHGSGLVNRDEADGILLPILSQAGGEPNGDKGSNSLATFSPKPSPREIAMAITSPASINKTLSNCEEEVYSSGPSEKFFSGNYDFGHLRPTTPTRTMTTSVETGTGTNHDLDVETRLHVENLEQLKSDLESSNNELQKRVMLYEDENAGLNAEVSSLKEQLETFATLQEEFRRAQEEASTVRQQLQLNVDEQKIFEEDHVANCMKIESLTKDLQEMQSTLQLSQEKEQELINIHDQLAIELERVNSEKQALLEENLCLRDESEKAEKLAEMVEHLTDAQSEMEREFELREQNLKATQDRLVSVSSTLDESLSRIEVLENENRRLSLSSRESSPGSIKFNSPSTSLTNIGTLGMSPLSMSPQTPESNSLMTELSNEGVNVNATPGSWLYKRDETPPQNKNHKGFSKQKEEVLSYIEKISSPITPPTDSRLPSSSKKNLSVSEFKRKQKAIADRISVLEQSKLISDEKIASMVIELSSAKSTIERVEIERDRFAEELKAQTTIVVSMEQRFEQQESEAREESSALRKEISELESLKAQLHEELSNANIQIETLNGKVNEHMQISLHMENTKDLLQNSEAALNKIKLYCDDLQRECSNLKKEKDEVLNQMHVANDDNHKMKLHLTEKLHKARQSEENCLEELKECRSTLEIKLNVERDLIKKSQMIEEEILSKKKENQHLRDTFAETEINHSKAYDELMDQLQEMEQELSAIRAENQEIGREKKEIQNLLNNTEARLKLSLAKQNTKTGKEVEQGKKEQSASSVDRTEINETKTIENLLLQIAEWKSRCEKQEEQINNSITIQKNLQTDAKNLESKMVDQKLKFDDKIRALETIIENQKIEANSKYSELRKAKELLESTRDLESDDPKALTNFNSIKSKLKSKILSKSTECESLKQENGQLKLKLEGFQNKSRIVGLVEKDRTRQNALDQCPLKFWPLTLLIILVTYMYYIKNGLRNVHALDCCTCGDSDWDAAAGLEGSNRYFRQSEFRF
eukprot:UC4_evm1s1200